MNISRLFETSAVRNGFTLDINQNYCSEVFSLYGFHFELVAEKVIKLEKSHGHHFKFYIQRLTSKDPVLTYEQSQLEMFSLRNDRFCTYAITVHYWHNGKEVIKSTGVQQQHFGKSKSQMSNIFDAEIKLNQENLNDDEQKNEQNEEPKELFVMYSFTFPVD
jgi:BTB/POZ domain-containing protein 16